MVTGCPLDSSSTTASSAWSSRRMASMRGSVKRILSVVSYPLGRGTFFSVVLAGVIIGTDACGIVMTFHPSEHHQRRWDEQPPDLALRRNRRFSPALCQK